MADVPESRECGWVDHHPKHLWLGSHPTHYLLPKVYACTGRGELGKGDRHG
jgi:hypothetical protein